jgi:NADP-dependent 3-hydroxy acid dehydrogenase YdfG
MKRHFENKVVLVTGASRGIGRDVALAFAREGARLILAARSADQLAQVQEEVRALGADALSVPTDVTSSAAVKSLVDTAMDRFGRIDVLVNNAGIGKVGDVASPEFADNVRQTLKASLFGMIDVTQRVLPILRQQRSGTIVNMSSVMGRKAFARFGSMPS